MRRQPWVKVIAVGGACGLVAALAMTLVILALRYWLGLATPAELFGDRLAPLIEPGRFLALLNEFGGYDKLKQAGVEGVLGGQLAVGALGGALYSVFVERARRRTDEVKPGWGGGRFAAFFVALVWLVSVAALYPTLDTHYKGLPPTRAALATALGLLVSFASYGVALVLLSRAAARGGALGGAGSIGVVSGRRLALVGGLGAFAFTLANLWLLRRFFKIATFGYDGQQYLGTNVQPITPNESFYTVTKNVVDPRVNKNLWRLEVTGLVERPQSYTFNDLAALPPATQETTLMCISYSVGSGLMSNALWKGVPMKSLIEAAGIRPGVREVFLHAADGYSDSFAIEKALEDTTLVVYEMNGVPLPDKHGYPVRVIVPGLYGEKNVKWVTRIELVDHDAKGFYERQGWGPDFSTKTQSRIDAPDLSRPLRAGQAVTLKGVAFGGDARGVSKIEVSTDGGKSWSGARIDYQGSRLAWTLWSAEWMPERAGEYELVVRATDGGGRRQIEEARGTVPEGATGLHRVKARVEPAGA